MDKRIEKTLANARTAAIDVLASSGFAAFTMEAISEHSGISKSTLYRHWPDRIQLLADALETLNQQPRPAEPIERGQLRERVIELVTHLAAVFEGSRIASVMPALIEAAQHHPQVAAFLHRYSSTRRKTLVKVLQQAIASGELPANLNAELAALALSGPIFYCRLMSPSPFPQKKVSALVDLVLGRST